MTFDWAWLDLWFDFCCCWLCLQWEPTLLLAAAEKCSLLVILWVVNTAEQKGETVPNGMASGGKSGTSSSQRTGNKADIQERFNPDNVNTWFSAVPDFDLPEVPRLLLTSFGDKGETRNSRNCISIFFYRTIVWSLQSDLQVQNYSAKPHCLQLETEVLAVP